jgi:hypothetical protein
MGIETHGNTFGDKECGGIFDQLAKVSEIFVRWCFSRLACCLARIFGETTIQDELLYHIASLHKTLGYLKF